jgi:hypothetical protein
MHKEVREIADKLIAQGWTISEVGGGGHSMACPPDKTKRCVPLPSTPGRGRWKQNLTSQLRRSGAIL